MNIADFCTECSGNLSLLKKKKLSQQNLVPFSFMAVGKKADLTVKNGIFCEHLVVKGLMREMVSPSLT